MGLGLNLIIVWFCITFALYLAGMETGLTNVVSGKTFEDMMSGKTNILTNIILTIIAGVTIGGIVATVFGRTIQEGVIASIVVSLVAFVSFPTSFAGEAALPTAIKLFVDGIFGIMWLIILISWYRGMEM